MDFDMSLDRETRLTERAHSAKNPRKEALRPSVMEAAVSYRLPGFLVSEVKVSTRTGATAELTFL